MIQIDGLHVIHDLALLAATGIDQAGRKHPPGSVEGASESYVTAPAMIEPLIMS